MSYSKRTENLEAFYNDHFPGGDLQIDPLYGDRDYRWSLSRHPHIVSKHFRTLSEIREWIDGEIEEKTSEVCTRPNCERRDYHLASKCRL